MKRVIMERLLPLVVIAGCGGQAKVQTDDVNGRAEKYRGNYITSITSTIDCDNDAFDQTSDSTADVSLILGDDDRVLCGDADLCEEVETVDPNCPPQQFDIDAAGIAVALPRTCTSVAGPLTVVVTTLDFTLALDASETTLEVDGEFGVEFMGDQPASCTNVVIGTATKQ